MSNAPPLRDFIYLDPERVLSLAAQLQLQGDPPADRAGRERLFLELEPALLARSGAARIDATFDFARWVPETFTDGQFVTTTGVVRLLDFAWLTLMEALKNSDEGRRMSKQALQQRQNENQVAITKVEEFKADELGEVVGKLYGDIVRVKIRPSKENPQCALVGSANARHFYDSPAALSQKYGIEIDAGWTIVGQLNVPNPAALANPMPVGNKMEDAFEQIALLMNNAFRLANAPAFPAVSLTPIAIYRTVG